MTSFEYMSAVIGLFRSGRATPEQWLEMANAVLYCAANECGVETFAIDSAIGCKEMIQ
jgi:hypothetical protein